MREVRWASLEHDGIEHLAFERHAFGSIAESVVVGRDEGRAYGVAYRVVCDEGWRAKHVIVTVMGGGALELRGDGEGRWRNGADEPLAMLDGSIDVDIAATPYTNTLPIRRLRLARDERRPIDVVYISIPDLTVGRMRQAYRCIEPDRVYRYESVASGFTAQLEIDRDGLVLDYEALFRRLPADAR
ncbi:MULTISPECIES: putative glycolipid-binding domain-containing protein [Burkholderia]|uniref:Transcriptional regulator n=1 Tax=Burkholderia savannae TaxID=1637837 RepID=A0ABR5T596_9BURK|nr:MULTISPECIES: putative glycolipid-binding domain-containing protein [Burkholderia]AOJ71700.1 transcriptional regulator [Burkholderia savannae]AOJ83589.1 transcriptional regulator [Burkholderia savannae]AOK50157.1 transcriptional regulator [Burkholderia sp. MSMB617WGS]KGS08092.1 glycolipid-binding family protein [Burkholderia sp. ABCPW 111]KVG47724.1 transcriptional regulator [Burkholderia sp. MSMB0265]